MPCPTCDHSMNQIGTQAGSRLFWCPRCGTTRREDAHPLNSVPKLVERCRNLQSSLIEAEQPDGIEALRMLGILESINLPEQRPEEPK